MSKDLKKRVKPFWKRIEIVLSLFPNSSILNVILFAMTLHTQSWFLQCQLSTEKQNFLIQNNEDCRVAFLVLVGTGIEMEFREIVRLTSSDDPDSIKSRERGALQRICCSGSWCSPPLTSSGPWSQTTSRSWWRLRAMWWTSMPSRSVKISSILLKSSFEPWHFRYKILWWSSFLFLAGSWNSVLAGKKAVICSKTILINYQRRFPPE